MPSAETGDFTDELGDCDGEVLKEIVAPTAGVVMRQASDLAHHEETDLRGRDANSLKEEVIAFVAFADGIVHVNDDLGVDRGVGAGVAGISTGQDTSSARRHAVEIPLARW